MGRAATGSIMKISQCWMILMATFPISHILALEDLEENLEKVQIQSSREPKLFYVSTSTSTTTLTTSSICHIIFSTALGVQTCVKKKRSINFLEDLPIEPTKYNLEDVAPSPSSEALGENEPDDLLSGIEGDGRPARFLNYWMTRVVTSTFTTYTSTSSLGSLYCTPIGYTDIACPNNG